MKKRAFDDSNIETAANADLSREALARAEREVWQPCGAAERDFLLRIAPFRALTARAAMHVLQADALPGYAVDLLEQCPYIDYDAAGRRYRPHDTLRAVLLKKLDLTDRGTQAQYRRRAGEWLAQNGETVQAFECYRGVRDYDAMLALRLCNMGLTVVDGMPFYRAAAQLLRECPAETKKYPLSLLRIAYAFYAAGQIAAYRTLMEEIRGVIETIDAPEKTREQLRGEWTFISAFAHYPDPVKMADTLAEAARLAPGGVEALDATEPFLFGVPGIFGVCAQRPGEAEESIRALSRCVDRYAALTGGGGRGADLLCAGEAAYFRGEPERAAQLFGKAEYTAQLHGQQSVRLATGFASAQLAIQQKDVPAFAAALRTMEDAAHRPPNAPLLGRIYEACVASLRMELESYEEIAPWIESGDRDGFSPVAALWTEILRLRVKFIREGHARTVGYLEALLENAPVRAPLLFAVLYFYLAWQRDEAGDAEQAEAAFEQGAALLEPDGLCMIFANFYGILRRKTDARAKHWDAKTVRSFERIRQPYALGRKHLQKWFAGEQLPGSLSAREYEIALLAAEGQSNARIAGALGLTEQTIKTHMKNIFRKLKLDKREQLTAQLGKRVVNRKP